ncbi:MAG: protein translocase subunit SecF [Alphaproteobacteria bacterium]|nr:MAG: protein translocase subunit SecF [Alphaproteobacteria bacterium]
MKLIRLVPGKTSFDFVQWRKLAFIVSLSAVVASAGLFFTQDLNYGIDFKGGTSVVVQTEGPADLGAIRAIVDELGLGDVQVQGYGKEDEVFIRVEQQVDQPQAQGGVVEGEDLQPAVSDTIIAALEANYPGGVTLRSVEMVGPKVSGELIMSGLYAVLGAVALMLVYIWWKFDRQFSIGAVAALVHDVILTVGMFSLTQIEFNLSIIAAILTIVGYSMNDTVVVYDRVRENLRKYKKMDLGELLNLSINETLSRTTMTSFTTLLALFSLFILGGAVIKGFTFAMIWGIFVGTYSSIFVAAPILMITGVNREWTESGVGSKEDA